MERLYRSRTDKMISGLSGGLGNYFNLDPAIIRVIFVLLTLFNGIGLLLYIILWIVIPFEPENNKSAGYNTQENTSEKNGNIDEAEIIEESETPKQKSTKPKINESNKKSIIGIALIVIGSIFLADRFLPAITMKIVIPTVLIVGGIYLLLDSKNKDNDKKEA